MSRGSCSQSVGELRSEAASSSSSTMVQGSERSALRLCRVLRRGCDASAEGV